MISSIITPQITRVFPIDTKTDPLACGAIFSSKLTGRTSLSARPSARGVGEFNRPQITQINADEKLVCATLSLALSSRTVGTRPGRSADLTFGLVVRELRMANVKSSHGCDGSLDRIRASGGEH